MRQPTIPATGTTPQTLSSHLSQAMFTGATNTIAGSRHHSTNTKKGPVPTVVDVLSDNGEIYNAKFIPVKNYLVYIICMSLVSSTYVYTMRKLQENNKYTEYRNARTALYPGYRNTTMRKLPKQYTEYHHSPPIPSPPSLLRWYTSHSAILIDTWYLVSRHHGLEKLYSMS